jgi:hypothetical protein
LFVLDTVRARSLELAMLPPEAMRSGNGQSHA